jgi:ABC-type sugar transport system permease subunit
MSLFCLLWTPLFYFFRKSSVLEGSAGSGSVWALLLGSITALAQFLLGPVVEPVGFGLSRWLNACIDMIGLPAVLPLLVYFLFVFLRVVSGSADAANFALLWLIPGGALRAVSWSPQRDPSLLVLIPFLWTAVAVGIPFFINIILNTRIAVIIPASLGILIVPILAATVYWAFFSQDFFLGFLLLPITASPMIIAVIRGFLKTVS